MLENEISILGIAGSPRSGNSEILAKAALSGAESWGAAAGMRVSTMYIGLHDKRIEPCRGTCFRRCHPADVAEKKGNLHAICERDQASNLEDSKKPPWFSCIYSDDAPGILDEMIKADALIIASPVYHTGIPSLLKALMDRCNSLVTFEGEENRSALAMKPAAAIAVGGARHAGQEAVLAQLTDFFMSMQMVPVGLGECDGYKGLAVVAERVGDVFSDTWVNYNVKHANGMDYARRLGAKVARMALILRLGMKGVKAIEGGM